MAKPAARRGPLNPAFPIMTELEQDEQFYRDTESIAFPKLDDQQLAMLDPLGARRIVRRGELVFKAGQRDLGLTAVLRGELEVFELRDGQEQILATFGPRSEEHTSELQSHVNLV